MTENIESIINNISKLDEGTHSNGKIEPSIVSDIENELSILFPNSFKKFITIFGSGKINYFDFFGAKPNMDINKTGFPNIIFLNKIHRKDYKLNKDLIIFGDSNDGDLFVISCYPESFGCIYFWNPSLAAASTSELEKIDDNIEGFLSKIINDEI